MADIGKPLRKIRVEPERVAPKPTPVEPKRKAPASPEKEKAGRPG